MTSRLSWLKRWKRDRTSEKPPPLWLPPEIWLHIISFLPPPDRWRKSKLYRLNSTFLDYYTRKRYQDIVLFNPLHGLDGLAVTQLEDNLLTRRNLAVLRDPRRSGVVKSLKIRFKVQYYDAQREAADPMNLEIALRSYLALLKEEQSIPLLPLLNDPPAIKLPGLNKLTLDFTKATGFSVNPSKLLDKSLKDHLTPFLANHANSITTFSFSTPEDDPQLGDACFLNLPSFSNLETLSIRLSSDSCSTWKSASQFLQRHAAHLKRLKITFAPLRMSEERGYQSTPPSPVQHRSSQLLSTIPMPALTEFQLWTNSLDHLSPSDPPPVDSQIPTSTQMLERIILARPLSTPKDLRKLIRHLESSNSAQQLRELFIPKASLDLVGLSTIARAFPQLRRLLVYSIDLKSLTNRIDGTSDAPATGTCNPCSDWNLEHLDLIELPTSGLDTYTRSLAKVLSSKVNVYQTMNREAWVGS